MERLDEAGAEPTEAENPCDPKQAARAEALGRVGVAAPTGDVDAASPFEGEVVDSRLATDGVFESPHPAAPRASSVSTEASTSVTFILSKRKPMALKQL
jgi:hypothetical protein